MNNNTPAILKSLITYALIVPLAIWMGYLLTDPMDRSTFGIGGFLALLLCAPILLRWHHLLLVASWNFAMLVFFLPGAPLIWLPMVALSLGISILHRSLNSDARFLSAPPVTNSLILLAAVVIFTAELTGGIGLKSMGSASVGGKRYVWLLAAILGYFALTARRIPPKQAGFYVALFFLSGCSSIMGDFYGVLPSFVFNFFPGSVYAMDNSTGQARYASVASVGQILFVFMLARYGVRGIFMSGKLWRVLLFGMFSLTILLGGFRSSVMMCGLIFAIQFFMERLQHSRLVPVFVFVGIFLATLAVPFSNKLPYTFQRSLSFLPIKIDEDAKIDAQSSSDWRLQMWQAMLPQVPGYLLLGKGYSLSAADFAQASNESFQDSINPEDRAAAFSGNFHSGPLSVIIFFGIWGVVAVIWFWGVCLRALYDNYRYGSSSLQIINGMLFSLFISKIVIFLFIFGSLYSDMVGFVGYIGLGVSLNGGICRRPAPAARAVSKANAPQLARPPFQPAFPR